MLAEDFIYNQPEGNLSDDGKKLNLTFNISPKISCALGRGNVLLCQQHWRLFYSDLSSLGTLLLPLLYALLCSACSVCCLCPILAECALPSHALAVGQINAQKHKLRTFFKMCQQNNTGHKLSNSKSYYYKIYQNL